MFRVFFSLLLIFSSFSLRSQNQLDFLTGKPVNPSGEQAKPSNDKKIDWKNVKDKVFYGGNIGLQFGTFTFIDISPMLGYRVTDKFSVGVGYTFNYLNNRYSRTSLIIRGGRVFARYFVFPQLFLHAEYEGLQGLYANDRTQWLYTPLVGLGYRQAIGARVYFDLQALWNLNPTIYSPYSNPVIRGGLIFR